MKHRRVFILLTFFTLLAFVLSAISFLTQPTSAQTDKSENVTIQNKTLPRSPRIKKIISGAKEPNQIPDNVAYELFLRTVAEGNARALVKRAGLTEEQVEKVMEEAYSLNSALEYTDRVAKELKEKQTVLTKQKTKMELLCLQKDKDGTIALTIKSLPPRGLSKQAINKLQNFIETEVKSRIRLPLLYNIQVLCRRIDFHFFFCKFVNVRFCLKVGRIN